MKWSDLNAFSKFLFLLMGALAVLYIAWEVRTIYTTPKSEPPRATPVPIPRAAANVQRLLETGDERGLVALLKNDTPAVRDAATTALWRLWQRAAGPEAESRLQAGIESMAKGQLIAAVDQFTKLAADYPDFAEAFNQRAIAYFNMEDFERAIQDCLKTTELNKNHFGAWNGLGRCYLSIRRYDLAQSAFERALELQPASEENKRLIEFCRERKKNAVPRDLNNSA